MDHIHNETVLAFLKGHKDNPNVRRFLRKQNHAVEVMNKELGTDYRNFLDYLEANIGDDAEFTMAQLEKLPKSGFDESH